MTAKKKSSKTPPPLDADLSLEFMMQFKPVDDRGAVILAGAILEVFLGALLAKAFKPSETERDVLLDERGVLSNLYAKSHVAYRLGLIDKEMFNAIELVRGIRNIYAHKLEYSKLNDEPFASQILNVYKTFSWYPPYTKATKFIFGATEDGLMQFKSIATFLVNRLEQANGSQAPIHQSSPFPFIPNKWRVFQMGQQIGA